MYGLWYIVFGSIALIGLGITFILISRRSFYENEILLFVGIVIIFIFAISTVATTICAIVDPINAKKEVNQFCEQKAIVEQVLEDSENLDNVAINATIIELNTWLAEAKANKKTYGCFSKYCYINFEAIEPISRNKKE